MNESAAATLEAWASFYVIVGSSAGALTGLQFVVMTLVAESRVVRSRGESIAAFGTPNVVHFCAALLVSSILAIPWSVLSPAGIAIAVCGALGVVYSAIVMRRARRQKEYEPVLEDWIWHTALPAIAYATLFVAGAILAGNSEGALFVIGPATVLLVFVGIHNAWDTVTFVATQRELPRHDASASAARRAAPPAAAAVTRDFGSAAGSVAAREAPPSSTPGVK